MSIDPYTLDSARWERQMALHLEAVAIAKKVWEDLLTRNGIDEITWLRLGHAYLQLGDNIAAIACLIISKVINRAGKAATILKNLSTGELKSFIDEIEKKIDDFLCKYQISSILNECKIELLEIFAI